MSDGFIQVPPDSTGKFLDTSELTVGLNTVERQRLVIADPTSATGLLSLNSSGLIGTESALPSRGIVNKKSSIETSASLGSNAVFTGTWHDTLLDGTNYVQAVAFANQGSATSGFQIQQSWDTSTSNLQEVLTSASVAISTFSKITAVITARYWRVVYTNGSVAQASFELTTSASQIPFQESKDANRTSWMMESGVIVIPNTSNNLVSTSRTTKQFVTTTAVTGYTVTPGKTLRVTNIQLGVSFGAGSLFSFWLPVAFNATPTNATTPSLWFGNLFSGAGNVFQDFPFPDGLELPGGWQIGIAYSISSITSSPQFNATITGYEY